MQPRTTAVLAAAAIAAALAPACAGDEEEPAQGFGRESEDEPRLAEGESEAEAEGEGGGECASAAQCDDGLRCTQDACVDGACVRQPEGAHLLLAEVIVRPDDAEAVEILNPTGENIDLSGVMLADFVAYHAAPAGGPYDGAGTADFLVAFPQGASLAPCARAVVSLQPAVETGRAGVRADYEVLAPSELGGEDDHPEVPELVSGFGRDPTRSRSLTNGSELLVLFRVEGERVRDLDYVTWGTDLDERVDKTGIAGYAPDTPPAEQSSLGEAHAEGGSFHRCDAAEGGERREGGNGAQGHDETSEPLGNTWRTADMRTPGVADPGCP